MEEILYAYWLSNLDGIGNKTIRALREYAGSLQDIWNLTPDELGEKSLGLTAPMKRLILTSRDESAVKKSFEEMQRCGISFYHIDHPEYPRKLKYIYDPPQGIYVKGRLPDPNILSVAMVGARNCSEYGKMMSRKLSVALAGAGIQIISGMARGIDGISQEAALEAGGYTCGVLGCGVDICYPEENRILYDRLITSGGLISEYHPGVAAKSGQFPLRNRIISALSDIVIIVEARERSGSLITADQALEQGRDVYTLPGRVCDALSQGCNRLIRQGAGIILSPEDFLKEIAAGYGTAVSSEETGTEKAGTGQLSLTASCLLSDDEKRLLSAMDYTPKSIGELCEASGLDTGRIYGCLMQLSLKGLILQKGSRYVIAHCS